jgi:hypothetical protein
MSSGTDTVSIRELSNTTAISAHDIIRYTQWRHRGAHSRSTLQSMGLIKYWRGKHVIVPRPPVNRTHIDIGDL